MGEAREEPGSLDWRQIVNGPVYATKELRHFPIRERKADSP